MRRSITVMLSVITLVTSFSAAAAAIPLAFSAKGGIGTGSFAMDGINDQLSRLRGLYGGSETSLDGGFQVYLEGRVWFFDRVAVLAGFEHYWASTDLNVPGDDSYIYEAPTSVLLLGGAVNIFKFPKLVDLNIGARGSFAEPVFGTNEADPEATALDEFKNNSYGWDIFVEATSNFLRPFEVGIMVGYRNLKVTDLEDKLGNIATFSGGGQVELDYSGTFFYLTAGLRLW